jgi:hypothetical protein
LRLIEALGVRAGGHGDAGAPSLAAIADAQA